MCVCVLLSRVPLRRKRLYCCDWPPAWRAANSLGQIARKGGVAKGSSPNASSMQRWGGGGGGLARRLSCKHAYSLTVDEKGSLAFLRLVGYHALIQMSSSGDIPVCFW